MGSKLLPKTQYEWITFGDRLKDLRREKHYDTQQALAEAMEVSIETVRNWEQGRRLPETATLFKLCKLLDCDMDFLTGRIDHTTHARKFIHDQTGLSEKAIEKLQSFMTVPDWDQMEKDLRESAPEIPEEKIRELMKRERERYETSIERDFPDIISLLIEDTNAEYLLSLITRRVKGYKPQTRPAGRPLTHKELTQDDLYIDLDGQRVLTHKKNMLDSLIQSEVASMIPVITETYHSINSEIQC